MRTFFLTLALALALSCKIAGNEIVAMVSGREITKMEFARALSSELSKYDASIVNDKDRMANIKKDVLDDLIKNSILYAKAVHEGITVTEDELARQYLRYKSQYTEATFQKMLEIKGLKYDEWKEEKKEALLVDKLVEQEVVSKINVTDADIKSYYKRHKKEFTRGDEVHARQIVLDALEKAEGVYKRIISGENFAVLAQEFSIAPEGKNGGDLGWFPRGVMPKEFDEACFPLPTGEISPIVRTEYGYHIFKVVERRSSGTVPLKDLSEKIDALVRQEKTKDVFEKWFEQIKSNVKVEINQKVLEEVK